MAFNVTDFSTPIGYIFAAVSQRALPMASYPLKPSPETVAAKSAIIHTK